MRSCFHGSPDVDRSSGMAVVVELAARRIGIGLAFCLIGIGRKNTVAFGSINDAVIFEFDVDVIGTVGEIHFWTFWLGCACDVAQIIRLGPGDVGGLDRTRCYLDYRFSLFARIELEIVRRNVRVRERL